MKGLLAALLCAVVFAEVLTYSNVRQRRQLQVNPKCDNICLAVYDPVCATNNVSIRSFGNGCKLDNFNCNARPRDRYWQIPKHYCPDLAGSPI